MQEQNVTQLREWWLEQATSFLVEYMVQQGLPYTSVRVSCGWPSRGGLALRATVIGQCFPGQVCKDGKPQIFISPRLVNSVEVLGTLLHELIHAAVGCQYGHRKEFSQAARRGGLDGRPTATVVGDSLRPTLEQFIAQYGAYPHAAIQPRREEKKMGSRLRLYECQCPSPVKVRVASDTFQARCVHCGELFTQSLKRKLVVATEPFCRAFL